MGAGDTDLSQGVLPHLAGLSYAVEFPLLALVEVHARKCSTVYRPLVTVYRLLWPPMRASRSGQKTPVAILATLQA